jgi:hypothetical protein
LCGYLFVYAAPSTPFPTSVGNFVIFWLSNGCFFFFFWLDHVRRSKYFWKNIFFSSAGSYRITRNVHLPSLADSCEIFFS